jgi:hypothetical protein
MLLQTLSLTVPIFFGSIYKNSDVGVQISLPEQASVVANSQIPPYCIISSPSPNNMWHLRLDRSPNPSNLSPKEIVHQIRSRREDPAGTKVLADNELTVGDDEGSIGWWLLLEEPKGVFGWLAIPSIGKQTVIASVLTTKDVWKTQGNSLLESMQTLKILDPIELVNQKMDGLDAAEDILSTLCKKTLEPLAGFHEWRRIQSTDSSTGSTNDVGYMQVSIESGNANEITKNSPSGSTNPSGIIVSLRLRLVPNPETGVVVDSVGNYWMSWDGMEERWSNRITRWMERASSVKTETGIRNRAKLGMAKPTILVMQQDMSSNEIETPFQAITEKPWLPRALTWIIGPLLCKNNANNAKRIIWHCYDNNGVPRATTRTDIVSLNGDGTKTIHTDFGSATDKITSTFNYDGRLIKQIQQGNILVTGSSKDVLRRIWEPKNLW